MTVARIGLPAHLQVIERDGRVSGFPSERIEKPENFPEQPMWRRLSPRLARVACRRLRPEASPPDDQNAEYRRHGRERPVGNDGKRRLRPKGPGRNGQQGIERLRGNRWSPRLADAGFGLVKQDLPAMEPDAGASAGDRTRAFGHAERHRAPSASERGPPSGGTRKEDHALVRVGSAAMPAPFALALRLFRTWSPGNESLSTNQGTGARSFPQPGRYLLKTCVGQPASSHRAGVSGRAEPESRPNHGSRLVLREPGV